MCFMEDSYYICLWLYVFAALLVPFQDKDCEREEEGVEERHLSSMFEAMGYSSRWTLITETYV